MVKKTVLTAAQQKKVVSLWKGSSKNKPLPSIAGIVRETKLPRRKVMECIEENGLEKFSPSSYK